MNRPGLRHRAVEALMPARLGRGFRRLLVAFWISNLADGITLAAAPLLVASQTDSPFLVGLAPMLTQLPWLLFGLHAGAIADRIDRRRMLIVANVVRICLVVGLATLIAADAAPIAAVLVAVFLIGTAECFLDTVASTLLPMLVERDDLGVGNNRLMVGNITLNQLAGPPVGAALFGVGMAVPFVGQAVLLLAAVVTLVPLALPAVVVDREPSHVRADIVAGVRWLWNHAPMRTLAVVIFMFNITWGASWSVLVLYAEQRLGMGEVGFGLLTSASAVGGLLSSAVYDRLERRVPLGTLMRACLACEVLLHLVLAVTTEPWMGLAVMFGFGVYATVWSTVSSTVRQRAVPHELQGRVSGVYLVAVFGGIVLGSAIGGAIAELGGITAPFWVSFVGTGMILAAVWRQLPNIAHAS